MDMDREKQLQRLIHMKGLEALLPFLMNVIESQAPKELADEYGRKYGNDELAQLKIDFLNGLQDLESIAVKVRSLITKDIEARKAAPRN